MLHNLMMENQSLLKKMVFEELAGQNLTLGQPKILEYLYSHDGAYQKDIAEACQIEPATITSLLERMEKNGLIIRKNSDGDKRYICVYLTELGKENGKIVLKAFESLERTALDGFSSEDKEKFIFYLEKTKKNLIQRKEVDKLDKKRNL